MAERLGGTVTFLFTDIEGSTTLLKRLGRERYSQLLARHHALLRAAFAQHRGEEIDTQGDSFLVAFRSASNAVAAAVAVPLFALGSGNPHTTQTGAAVSCSDTAAPPNYEGAPLDLTGVYKWPSVPGFYWYVRQAGTCVYSMYQDTHRQLAIAGTFTGGIEPNLTIPGIWSDVPYATIQGHGRLVWKVSHAGAKLALVVVYATAGFAADKVVLVKKVTPQG